LLFVWSTQEFSKYVVGNFASGIVHAVLYECDSWSLVLKEKHRLRLFEIKLLRRILGPKEEEVTGGWKKLHIEEFCNLYSSPYTFRVIKSGMMRWLGCAAHIGEMRNAYKFVIGKPKGKSLVGRPGCRWEDNIKMHLGEIDCEDVNWSSGPE